MWPMIGTSGGLLWTQWWTFGFHKRRGISWLTEWLLGSQGGLRSTELVSWLISCNSVHIIRILIVRLPVWDLKEEGQWFWTQSQVRSLCSCGWFQRIWIKIWGSDGDEDWNPDLLSSGVKRSDLWDVDILPYEPRRPRLEFMGSFLKLCVKQSERVWYSLSSRVERNSRTVVFNRGYAKTS
jgi:hypothetical protein